MPSLLPRVTQKVFGGSLTPSGNIAQFGSLAAGAPLYSGDAAAIQTAAWLQGLTAALVGNRSPAWQDLNGVLYVLTQQLAYLLQAGVAEWDTNTIYGIDCFVRVGAVQYVSLTDANVGHNPVSDTTNWVPFTAQMRGPAVCAASVEFDGINVDGSGNSILHSSFNVDHVLKNANGSYTVFFTTPMSSVHYVFSGSCGSENAAAYGAGDDGVVVGNSPGQGNAIRSATACRIFTINTVNKALVASGDVSVMFFGR